MKTFTNIYQRHMLILLEVIILIFTLKVKWLVKIQLPKLSNHICHFLMIETVVLLQNHINYII